MSGFAIIKSLLRDDSGATAIEYGLIVSLIVIAMMGALTTFANEANDMFDDIETSVQDAREL